MDELTMRNKQVIGFGVAMYVERRSTMFETITDENSILEPGIVFVEPQATLDETRHMAWEAATRTAMAKYPPPLFNRPRVVVSGSPMYTKHGNTVEYLTIMLKREELN